MHVACGLTCGCDLSGSHRFPADCKAMCPECAPARHVSAAASVEVELELQAVVPVPRVMPSKLGIHCSLVGVVCRYWSASAGTETEQRLGSGAAHEATAWCSLPAS